MAVEDYFRSMPQPLIPMELFDLHIAIVGMQQQATHKSMYSQFILVHVSFVYHPVLPPIQLSYPSIYISPYTHHACCLQFSYWGHKREVYLSYFAHRSMDEMVKKNREEVLELAVAMVLKVLEKTTLWHPAQQCTCSNGRVVFREIQKCLETRNDLPDTGGQHQ